MRITPKRLPIEGITRKIVLSGKENSSSIFFSLKRSLVKNYAKLITCGTKISIGLHKTLIESRQEILATHKYQALSNLQSI